MAYLHLDMDSIIKEKLKIMRAQTSLPRKEKSEATIKISEENGKLLNDEYGPQQVESLLRYVMDGSLVKDLADAVDDEEAIRHLLALKDEPPKKTRIIGH